MNFLLFVSVQTPADIASYSGCEAKPQEDFFRSFEVRQGAQSISTELHLVETTKNWGLFPGASTALYHLAYSTQGSLHLSTYLGEPPR